MTHALPSKERIRARKALAAMQLDMFGLPPAPPPAPVVQSPRAAAIADETAMRTEAVRVLAAKDGKPPVKAAKPKVQKCKS